MGALPEVQSAYLYVALLSGLRADVGRDQRRALHIRRQTNLEKSIEKAACP
jgi:hypothetical protein